MGARLNAAECSAVLVHELRVYGRELLCGGCSEDCRLMGSSFAEADLSGLTISGGDWSWVNLRHQSFWPGQDLRGVKFVGADFYGADLTKE